MKAEHSRIGALVASLLMAATLVACDKPKGPAEQAGEKLDNAADKAGQQIEKAGEKIQDSAKGNK